ncbi:MAG: sodium:solute symporter [Candidatus Omnitrophota bacterium]|jgi:Na+/proline symporter|nr:MAG: sodium:solute symporter [Candidatus Omnitrophota bacterium]
MNPVIVIGIVLGYFFLLLIISFFSAKTADSKTFFTANKQSPWYIVAYGMVGASISGITYISVPGEVCNSQWTYFQMVIGYVFGIAMTAIILLPLYYRLNLVSIYSYLETRFGFWSYKTGAAFFLLSQSVVAAFRLYLMARVLQVGFFDGYGIPFEVTVFVTLALIWLYTYRAGIKTIVYTDTLQTTFLLLAAILSILILMNDLRWTVSDFFAFARGNPDTKMFVWQWSSDRNFFKLLLTGAFLTLVTNGLDQSVMQKHLTCRTLKDAQKNMFWFCVLLALTNLLFLGLGILLRQFALQNGIAIPPRTDDLYPLLAIHHFHAFAGIVFLLGISAAAYSSADSALTGLTTSFCVDFLNYKDQESELLQRKRFLIHFSFSLLLYLIIVIFKIINDESVINAFIRVSGYTYGPLLGLYAFGLFTQRRVHDRWVPLLCILSPLISILLYFYSETWLWGYKFGFEILLVNSAFTFAGLFFLRERKLHPRA